MKRKKEIEINEGVSFRALIIIISIVIIIIVLSLFKVLSSCKRMYI